MFKAKRLLAIIVLFLFVVIMGSCGGGGGGGSGGEPVKNFTLTVDKFGEGVVISDVSGIDCGDDCSGIYPSGTTVTLTAQDLVAASAAEGGYSFKSWAGCDSVDGTTCTVTMDGDKVVLPVFGREVVLQGETKILDENAMQYLISREDSIFYFDPGIESVVVLQVGDVIMGRVIGGNGFLRKITNIYTAAGELVVETEFATIPDAVAQGTLSFSKKLTHSDLAAYSTIIKSGVSLQRAESPDSTVFTFNVNTQVGQNGVRPAWGKDVNESFGIVNIQGTVSLTFEIDAALDKCFLCWPPIEAFRTVLIVTQDNDLNISASEGAEVEGSISLGTLMFPVSLSGVPATLEVEIFLGVNGEIEVTASTGARLTNKLTAGVQYRKDDGWSPVSGYSKSFTAKPVELDGSVSVKAYVKPECSLLIVGLAGPYMNLEAYLKLQGEALSATTLAWGLYYGLDSHVGVKIIKIFGFDIPPYSVDLLDPNLEWKLASDTVTIGNTRPTATITSPSDGSTYTHGESITFSGSGNDTEDGTLSGSSLVWTSSKDGQIGIGVSFSKSNLSVGTHTITLVATDSKGKSGNTSINITLTAATSLTITSTSLPSGKVGVSYPATNLSATGGKTPYTWSWSGNTPHGLNLSTDGIISGTPTTSGTYSFTVQVKDSSSPQQADSKALSIVVNPSITPTVASVNPGSGQQGKTLTVTITGANLTGATSVSFGAGVTVNSFTVNSSTQITANISISSTATTGAKNVSVTTPAGTGIGNGLFTVLAATGGVLSVTPGDRFDSSGTEGGPFSPSHKTYTLSNTGGSSINWTVSKGQGWVSLSATSGTLSPGGSTQVDVSINTNANSLTPNVYSDTVSFTNTTNSNGNQSRTVSLTVTSTPVIPPAAPSNLSATALSQSVIALVWQDNSGNESGFKIERKTGTTGTYSQITTVSAISGSGSGGYYEDSGLAASTTYCYRIRAYNSAGDSSYSSESCATTQAPPCATPTATTGSATNITSNSATLNATVNPNGVSTGGFFQYGTSTAYGYTTSNQILGSGTGSVPVSANLTGLSPNTTYHFRIIATNSCGGTVYGSDQSFTTLADCSPPGSFSLSADAYCNTTPPAAPAVMLTWTVSTGTDYYDIYRNGSYYDTAPSTYTTYDNNLNVVAGETYTYSVVARNSCDNTQSNTVTVTVPSNVCERITNGSFSSGTTGWTLWGDFWAGTDVPGNSRTTPGYAAGGVDSNGYTKDNANGYMYQTVTIPSNATSATLSFWYNITSQEISSSPYDVLNVTIKNSSGGYLATVAVLSNLNKETLGAYSQKTFDVMPYKGQTIRINFWATTNSSITTVFRIDDVSLMSDGN